MNEWISIEDRLPEEKLDVILFGIKCPTSFIGYLDGEDFVCDNANEFVPVSYISHWMPLPEPPE